MAASVVAALGFLYYFQQPVGSLKARNDKPKPFVWTATAAGAANAVHRSGRREGFGRFAAICGRCDNRHTMRELHGVLPFSNVPLSWLKKYLLIFDRFHIPETTAIDCLLQGKEDFDAQNCRDRTFLEELGLLRIVKQPYPITAWEDYRSLSVAIGRSLGIETIPVCLEEFPVLILDRACSVFSSAETVFAATIPAFPVPDETCAWQDVLDFKADRHDKQWAFRRFLHDLATKRQTEAEIRDDIDWTLNEYAKEMDRSKLKRSASFMETYVIPTVEAFESFKASAFLKGRVSIKKRKIDLLEGEAKAPGKECAYVFDARNRFGKQ
jgi:hypothetical protein